MPQGKAVSLAIDIKIEPKVEEVIVVNGHEMIVDKYSKGVCPIWRLGTRPLDGNGANRDHARRANGDRMVPSC